jgi:hypothetical protein
MNDQLVVDTDAMRAHAGLLDSVAAGLAEACDASVSTAMPDNSFGILCAFLLPVVTTVQGAAAAGVTAAAAAVSAERGAILGSARAYDTVDSAVGRALTSMKELLP